MKWIQYLFITLAALNMMLFVQLFFSEYGIKNYLELKEVFANTSIQKEQLKEKNQTISKQIRWIRNQTCYQEYIVRKERRYAKPSERIYILKK